MTGGSGLVKRGKRIFRDKKVHMRNQGFFLVSSFHPCRRRIKINFFLRGAIASLQLRLRKLPWQMIILGIL